MNNIIMKSDNIFNLISIKSFDSELKQNVDMVYTKIYTDAENITTLSRNIYDISDKFIDNCCYIFPNSKECVEQIKLDKYNYVIECLVVKTDDNYSVKNVNFYIKNYDKKDALKKAKLTLEAINKLEVSSLSNLSLDRLKYIEDNNINKLVRK